MVVPCIGGGTSKVQNIYFFYFWDPKLSPDALLVQIGLDPVHMPMWHILTYLNLHGGAIEAPNFQVPKFVKWATLGK